MFSPFIRAGYARPLTNREYGSGTGNLNFRIRSQTATARAYSSFANCCGRDRREFRRVARHMLTAFLVPFFFATPPASSNACTTAGVPLFEMRDRNELDKSTVTTRIFESGAWTIDTSHRSAMLRAPAEPELAIDSASEHERGCFDRKELKEIRRAVQRAPWQVTTSPIACFARSLSFTDYFVHGSLRFTDRVCSGKTVDVQTRHAIDLVKQEIAADKPPVEPPSKPPVAACPIEGTPVFEIRKRSDVPAPTSTIGLYASGAWTFQRFDKDGHPGELVTGCLDRSTTRELRTSIDRSPWQVTRPPFLCRAYSASYTEYYVHGRLEYTARLCGPESLDDTSLATIHLVEQDLATVLPVR